MRKVTIQKWNNPQATMFDKKCPPVNVMSHYYNIIINMEAPHGCKK